MGKRNNRLMSNQTNRKKRLPFVRTVPIPNKIQSAFSVGQEIDMNAEKWVITKIDHVLWRCDSIIIVGEIEENE